MGSCYRICYLETMNGGKREGQRTGVRMGRPCDYMLIGSAGNCWVRIELNKLYSYSAIRPGPVLVRDGARRYEGPEAGDLPGIGGDVSSLSGKSRQVEGCRRD